MLGIQPASTIGCRSVHRMTAAIGRTWGAREPGWRAADEAVAYVGEVAAFARTGRDGVRRTQRGGVIASGSGSHVAGQRRVGPAEGRCAEIRRAPDSLETHYFSLLEFKLLFGKNACIQ
jgi:hypothetical protein